MWKNTVLILLIASTLGYADWTQWRGPNRDGVATAFPAEWPKELQLGWKIDLGEGHSGPVTADGRVFTMARNGDNEIVSAWKLSDGSKIWSDSYKTDPELDGAVGWHGKMPRSTPCIADGRLYTFGVGGVLTCYSVDTGKQIWRNNFAKLYPRNYPLYGASTSPIIFNGMLILWVGGHNKGALVALDAKNGANRWSLPIDGPGYTSPIITEISGKKMLITQSQQFLIGVDPTAGKELWKTKFTTGYDQNSVTPLVVDDKVIYSGYQKALYAGSLTKAGAGFQLKEAWEVRDQPLYMNSPVVVGDRLFGLSMSSGGTLIAVSAKDGEVFWKKGNQGEHGTLIAAGSHVLFQKDDGKLLILKANAKDFESITEYSTAEEGVWAHPAVLKDALLVRSKTRLYYWKVK